MPLTPTPRLNLRRIDEPEGVDIDADLNNNWDKVDAFVSGEYDRPRPFYLKAAVYNSGQNRIDLTWGPGRARFAAASVVTKADNATSTIPAPSAATSYYVGLKSDGTFPVASSQAEQDGVVWLWQVTTGSPLTNPATLTDLRAELPGAYAQAVKDLLEAHQVVASVHGVTGNVVGTGGAQTLSGPKTLTAPVLTAPVIGATDWGSAPHAHAAANSAGQVAMASLTGAISVAQHGALGPITNAHALADLAGTISDAQHGARGAGATHAFGSITGTITDAQHGVRAVANAHAYSSLSGIPATFAPAVHNLLSGHNVSGLAAGEVLIATGATTVDFRALTSGDLPTIPFTALSGTLSDAQHGVRTQANAHGLAQMSGTISDAQHGVRSLANAHDWTDISGKPTTFTPAAHTLASHSGNISAGQHGALGAGATHTLHALLSGAAFTGGISGTTAAFSGEVSASAVDVAGAYQIANVNRITMSNGFLMLFDKNFAGVRQAQVVGMQVNAAGAITNLPAGLYNVWMV